MRLDRLDHLPNALCELPPSRILEVLPRPTLIECAGHKSQPLFVSTLLHGNETTSFEVLQALARRYAATPPPRSLMIFVGNVEAAAAGVRRLPGQLDFNRIWAGGDGPVFGLAEAVKAAARAATPFASVDIHNNTGTNPIYGCVSALSASRLQLAALFSRIGVLYHNPMTTQSIAFNAFCPSITVECGHSGNAEGRARALALLEALMHMDHLPPHRPPAGDLLLHETIGRIVIDEGCSFAFGGEDADLVLDHGLEGMNFSPMPAGLAWGRSALPACPLRVLDERGADLTDEFFEIADGVVRLRQAMTPSMITTDVGVIRQDCLGYLMRPICAYD